MKKRIASLLLAVCLIVGLTPQFIQEASADEYEQAWYPATRMYITQIAYESGEGASHANYNTIDIANTTDLSKEEKRVFAPFTGIIVYRNTDYGYVLLQSMNKVRYADGTVDYMTVGFMHDNDISELPLGKVIKQGEAFYDAGNTSGGKVQKDMGLHVQISVFKGQFYKVSGPKANGTYTIGKKLRGFNNGKLSPGDIYAFDAFSVNTEKTIANRYTEVGYLAKGHTVGKKGAPGNWNGRWKDLNGNVFPACPAISGQSAPSALKVGEKFSIKGTVSSKTKITSVTAGVYTAETGGTMVTGKTVQPSTAYKSTTRVTSYNLTKLDASVKFNTLAAGPYWYRVTAESGAGTTTLVNTKFTVGDTTVSTSPATSATTGAPILYPSAGWYTLTPACAPDMRLDVAYSGTSNEAPIWTWTANGTNAQFWYVLPDTNSHRYYSFVSGVDADANMVLDVQYGGTESGTPVWLYESNGTSAQQWLFLDAGDGYCYIIPRENHKLALAVKDGSSDEGSGLVIETRNDSAGQKWKLTLYE